MSNLLLPVIILVLILNASLNKNLISDYNTEDITTSVENSTDDISQHVSLNADTDKILGRDKYTKYFSRTEENGCVLYAINDNELVARKLAVFPAINSECLNIIINFGICGDWIILSVGHYEGSGNYFHGDFVRLQKDGSELEHFWLTESDNFVIVDDWIYYNFWKAENTPENVYGCYRIRPDGKDKEFMGDKIYSIILYAEDGYIYGEYNTGKMISSFNAAKNLIRCKPDGNGAVTLFSGEALPEFNDSDWIGYNNVVVEDDFVTFTVFVHGYSEGVSWRGHNMYTADYRVYKDGSNLVLLREHYAE